MGLQVVRRLGGGGHIGALGHCEHAAGHQDLCIVQGQLVLGGAGQRDIRLDAPDAPALVVLGVGTIDLVLGQALSLDLLDFLQRGHVDALGIIDPAVGIGAGDDLRAQLLGLLDGVDGHVAGAGDGDGLAFHAVAVAPEHLVGDVQQAVARGLGAGQRAAVAQPLACEHALEHVPQLLILAEQIADLPAADADIAGGHVGVCADVFAELGHKALAEAHDLPVGLSLGVEVRAALAAADGQAGQGILEDLLKAEELDDADIY